MILMRLSTLFLFLYSHMLGTILDTSCDLCVSGFAGKQSTFSSYTQDYFLQELRIFHQHRCITLIIYHFKIFVKQKLTFVQFSLL